MSTVFHSAFIPVDPNLAWQRIAAVGKVHEILPAVVSCTLDGDRRACTFDNGAVLEERVVAVDSELMRVAYTITDSPFGLEHHHASMQIVPEGEGARILWITDVKPDRLKADLAPLFEKLFGQLTERLAAA
jgi:carbon monoxide dehydrogenase subunit G